MQPNKNRGFNVIIDTTTLPTLIRVVDEKNATCGVLLKNFVPSVFILESAIFCLSDCLFKI